MGLILKVIITRTELFKDQLALTLRISVTIDPGFVLIRLSTTHPTSFEGSHNFLDGCGRLGL